jgi:hypothetical protein
MEKNQNPSIRIQIASYNKEDACVSYNMKVLCCEESFHIIDRYRNMRSLWEEIRKDAKNPDRIPDFPPKKWFGSRNREFLETRKSAVQNFFNTLLESPDKNIFNHAMKYFKKLAKNREAKDAISNIEEIVSEGPNKQHLKDNEPQNLGVSSNKKPEESKTSTKPSIAPSFKDPKTGVSSKDYSTDCNKIVEAFNKKLIDLGYTGADAIQEIMNKGQTYVNHFKDSGLNQKFKYNTKLLDIPKGNDDNLAILDTVDEDIETQDEEAIDKMFEKLNQKTSKLYKEQYEEYMTMNEILWRQE